MERSVRKKIIIIIIITILLLALGTVVYFLSIPKFHITNFKNEINIEYKTKFKPNYGNVCYGNIFKCNKTNKSYIGKVNTKKLKKYDLKYIYKYKNKKLVLKQKVSVVDRTPPKLEIESKEALICPNGKISELKVKAIDNYDGDVTNKIKTTIKDKLVIIKITDSSKNTTKKEIESKVEDKIGPVITINGSIEKNMLVGQSYVDEGAVAKDNCDETIEVETTNNVDTSKEGIYSVIYKATDKSGNESTIERKINVRSIQNGKRVVYLTFDDGPSQYTSQLLDVLKKYNVKVTFFVTGKGDDAIILREHQEGHKVALHTYSHNYATVYSSDQAYFDDLYKIQNRVKNITGYTSNLIRFPGGSSNTVSKNYSRGIMTRLTREVQNRGFHYYDWNVSSGDAGAASTSDQVYNNVVSSLKEGSSIVLQHDTQKFSIDAVERIIQYCNENGYTFASLNENSPTAHHGTNN
ncbi:MAG: polysaccharide deacetylase family protein [Bacilli bacterium]|nr:polysaccharide deacetylase family protein [Bacilli bacterium]MBO6195569.1 polysaccharide deacetylase family protein [Bacilli bacterium]